MKKIISFIIMFVLMFSLYGCNNDNTDSNNEEKNMDNIINIYTLNDFHGAIFEDKDEVGFSKIGDFLINEKKNYPNSTVIISAGDMFQGTAVSSMTKGQVVIDIMNEIGFDAMTIGNHEFDWGIDYITRYIDNNLENGETNFPLLGANIYQKSTNSIASWAKPYTVIERGSLKIGIIGTIGESTIYDIFAPIVEDYEFRNQLDEIKKYTEILRTEENCDIVIVSSHSDTSIYNKQLANLDGNMKVDAVINGHTHRYYAFEERGTREIPLPGVQSGNNGKYLGKITLELDPSTKQIIDVSAGFIDTSNEFKTENQKINEILNNYSDEIDDANSILGIAGEYITQNSGAQWAANSIKTYANTEFGIVNNGGIRSAAFPINENDEVTFGDIFKMMPFENTIVTLKLTGAQLKMILSNSSDLIISSNYSSENIEADTLYTISTIDYAFEREYDFKQGQDINYTYYLFRDHLVNVVKESAEENGKWYLNK